MGKFFSFPRAFRCRQLLFVVICTAPERRPMVGAQLEKQTFKRMLFGQNYEGLVAMSHKELAEKHLKCRLKRKLKRGLSSGEQKLLEKVRKRQRAKANNHKVLPIKTHHKEQVIMPDHVGLQFGVYNGKSFMDIEVKLDHVGHAVSDFIFTKKVVKHRAMGKGATAGSKHVALK